MKYFIKNRKGEKLAVLLEKSENQKGLAFVMHGLGGFKEQKHIQAFAEALLENNYTVVRFDTTNTFGESDGDFSDATVTNYYEDLEDVIRWASVQDWYEEPFVLVGHSLGAMCITLFAEKYPSKVKAIVPAALVVSGQLTIDAHKASKPDEFKKWEETGWLEQESYSKPGIIKRLKWSHVVDRLKYDLVPSAGNLTMPVLLIVGEKDNGTPPEHQKILFNLLPGKKELHIIKGAEHSFRKEEERAEVKQILKTWLAGL